MVKVESPPEGERAAATSLYANVNIPAAGDIDITVETEFTAVTALLPASTPPNQAAEFRDSWLRKNYCRIVSCVLKAPFQTSAVREKWTFEPAVSIETLACEEQKRAHTAFAAVTREAADGSKMTHLGFQMDSIMYFAWLRVSSSTSRIIHDSLRHWSMRLSHSRLDFLAL